MSRKVVAWLGVTFVVCLLVGLGVVAYQAGLSKAASDEEAALEEIRRRSAAGARAFQQGLEDAGNEQAEKYRVMQEEDDARKRELYAQITTEGIIPYHIRTSPEFVEARNRIPEDERASFDQSFEAEWRKWTPPPP